MTENDQKQLGKTLWNIADQLRGAMNADDFRDYMPNHLWANIAHMARTQHGELAHLHEASRQYILEEPPDELHGIIWLAVGRFDMCVAAALSPGKDGASATDAERRGRIIQGCNMLVEEVHAIVKGETGPTPASPTSAPGPPPEAVGEAARSKT